MNWVTLLGALGLGGILGSLVQNWLTDRRENAKQKLEYIERQLQEFYNPLRSLHKEIRAHSQLRVKLQQALDDQHNAVFEGSPWRRAGGIPPLHRRYSQGEIQCADCCSPRASRR